MNESNKDEKYFAIIAVAVFSFHSTVAVFLALTQSDSISLGFNFTLVVSPVLRMKMKACLFINKVFILTIASPVAISSTRDVTLFTFAIVAIAVGALHDKGKH